MTVVTENLNIEGEVAICKPSDLKARLPRLDNHVHTVHVGQTAVKNVLDGGDHRLVVIVGPCSIHDEKAAREYAAKLKKLSDELSHTLLILMRVYFEKPRTVVGWKGLLNDPFLDNTCAIEKGLELGRSIMLDITAAGVPVAAEALDVLTPQYIQDLVSWTCIGARTTESPCHRQMASALSSTVGFKNGTDGSMEVAINAIRAASHPSSFLSCSVSGQVCVVRTKGNAHTHIVLRGGAKGPNYNAENIGNVEQQLSSVGLPSNILVDCSHGNSMKDYRRQPEVLQDVVQQIKGGNKSIFGVMLESNLNEGSQKLVDPSKLKYGVSITDACIGWEQTESLLRQLASDLRETLANRKRVSQADASPNHAQ
ncbi:Phospho-2-dehydro-3-deoxyheptonate aldolase [Diplonema papillatum]|nr:Phospho-2-dehydro-3-deoxyheptonate aldolase [Diplonema papillatum]|eukprot:gene13472-20757_t